MVIQKSIDRLASNPSIFILLRRFLENDFKTEKEIIREIFTQNESIIDIGCGTGEFSVLFNPKDYIGIDINNFNRSQGAFKKVVL